ncbi:hypothetical protein FGRMN_7622 [Fusarium graminum]|nr:hypothetical protein FGRMN_7622 [Fusarium graminum]
MNKKLIVVIGATGGQGGSVVNTFLHDPGWLVRGITRNLSSPKAEILKARGVELVQADLDDRASLQNAFQDADAIFAVSDFWGIYNDPKRKPPKPGQPRNEWTKEQETQQLKNIIDEAAKAPRLMPSNTGSGTSQVSGQKRQGNGNVQFATNLCLDNKIPLIAHEQDSGPLVKALILDTPGKNLVGYRGWLTPREFVVIFIKVTGYRTELLQLPSGEFSFDCKPELRAELQDNFAFANEVGLHGGDSYDAVHPGDLENAPQLGSIEAWIKEQDWSKMLELA